MSITKKIEKLINSTLLDLGEFLKEAGYEDVMDEIDRFIKENTEKKGKGKGKTTIPDEDKCEASTKDKKQCSKRKIEDCKYCSVHEKQINGKKVKKLCEFTIVTGKRIGNKCGAKAIKGSLCNRHNKEKTIVEESPIDTLDIEETVDTDEEELLENEEENIDISDEDNEV